MRNDLAIKMESVKEGDPNYCWVNIELKQVRVGKARIKRIKDMIIIKSITIFPEYERKGIAKQIVNSFKEIADEIIADRVRGSARGFWERMGFSDSKDGNYRWSAVRR